MRKTIVSMSVLAALATASFGANAAVTLADLGLPSDPYDFQIKFNNYEVLNPDTAADSGAVNTDGLYLGDSFGIFRVTTILDAPGVNSPANWASGGIVNGVGGGSVQELTGIFWGFDIVAQDGTTAFATGGQIALFANATWDVAIREQGPAGMTTTGTINIGGYDLPTYAGITGGELILLGNYASGCDSANASYTLCSPSFINVGGSYLGSAKGYVDIAADVGLGANFATGALATDTPGVFRDASVQSNFTPAALSGGTGSNWETWSFDPVFGRSQAVPEPSILALLGIGLVGIGAGRLRRGRKAA